MKKKLILLCFGIMVSIAGIAPPYTTLIIAIEPSVSPYEAITNAVAIVESNNNPLAYNPSEKATGLYQVRPIRLRDYNKRTGTRLRLREMYDPLKAKQVFLYYAMEIGHQNPEQIIREWNGGERGMKKQSTKEYFKKVKKYLDIKK